MADAAKPRGLHPEDIKAEVRKTGLSLSDLDRRHELPEGACRKALRYPNLRAEEAILAHLGWDAHATWPARYNPDGSSRIRRRHHHGQQPIAGAPAPHCLSGAAA